MRWSALLAVSTLMAIGLSGCASNGGDTASTQGGVTAPVKPMASASGGPNTAPTAILEASVPLDGGMVNFTVNGADAEHDSLRWTVSFGDTSPSFQGTMLPSKISHAYEPGSYTVNLTVDDGRASGYAVAAVTIAHHAAQSVDGHFVVETEGCAAAGYDQAHADPGGAAGGATNNVTRVQFTVAPRSIGQHFMAVFTFDTGYLYVSVDFFGSGGALVSSNNTGQSPAFGGATLRGVVPEGAATAVLFACGGPATATVHYEA